MEVVVAFQGGDPDHPFVIGCLNNALRMPTHALPDAKTKSGIRSNSSPGGDGNNEIMFEDAAGEEEIYMHAQRDLRERVERNHETHVDGERNSTVGGSRVVSVAESQTTNIGGAYALTVGADARHRGRRSPPGGWRNGGDAHYWRIRRARGGGATFAVARDLE